MFKSFSAALLALGLVAAPVSAASILTDISDAGTDTTFNNFNPSNMAFNNAMNALHTITMVGDFSNAASFNGMDAVWVNADFNGGTGFSATEATNVRNFIAAGHKGVIITDNGSWSAMNAQIETIIGATITDTCDSSTGTANAAHPLGVGVGTMNHTCGSILDPAANATVIVDQGIASLYSVGLGEVLVITSVDPFRNGSPSEPEFMNNIAAYLDSPLNVGMAPVPLPAGLPLLASGLGIVWFAKRRRKA